MWLCRVFRFVHCCCYCVVVLPEFHMDLYCFEVLLASLLGGGAAYGRFKGLEE